MPIEITLEAKQANRTFIMDLEGVAVPTRRVMFETLRAVLSEQGIAFDESAMIRHGVASPPKRMVAGIANHYGLKAAAQTGLLSKVTKALDAHFKSGAVSMALGLDRLLNAVRDAGGAMGILSWQSEEAARAVSERIGLVRWDPMVFAGSDGDREFPGVEIWANAIQKMGRGRLASTALCGSGFAVKSALAAGLRVVAAPDEFTSHQDYSGADALVDHIGDVTIEQVLGRS